LKIIWLTWKDRGHPQAGGAETISGQIMDRLVRDGHKVKMVTALYNGAVSHEKTNDIEIFRVGNRYTVYKKAQSLYKKKLHGWADLVIDEMNTIPFGSAFYSDTKNLLLCYQLAREVWLYQMPAPLSWLGYISEPTMLRVLSKKYHTTATESESTRKDLMRYRFKNVHTFRVGIALKPVAKLEPKPMSNIILSLGAVRPMKQTLHTIQAFEYAKDKNPGLKMVVAGDTTGGYAQKVMAYANASRYKDSITIAGRVSADERLKLMRDASIILVTSVKEGWGLIVTEANSQGTPAIVYDTDGLRDSVTDGLTGVLSTNNNPSDMGNSIVELLADKTRYETIRVTAWKKSKEFTFENSYKDFLGIINTALSAK
jgi:glycosyltransferase involved in cell wall biosynthesis